MFSEQLAIMLFLAATQVANPQAKAPTGPGMQDARHAMIRAVREPELAAALSLRATRVNMRKQHAVADHTLLASAE